MAKVAKLVIIDDKNMCLMMYRNAHPAFGDDPDLLGGTLEPGEVPLETMVREVFEEAGIVIDGSKAVKLYDGTGYSLHDTHYYLYGITLSERPEIKMSWEHSAYEWLEYAAFIAKALTANDTYMHMVAGELKNSL